MTLQIFVKHFSPVFRKWAEEYARLHSTNQAEYEHVLNFLIFCYQRSLMQRVLSDRN